MHRTGRQFVRWFTLALCCALTCAARAGAIDRNDFHALGTQQLSAATLSGATALGPTAATLTVGTANSLTGGVTINNGALVLNGNAASIASLPATSGGSVAALTHNSGVTALTKIGTGALTLGSPMTFTGTTTLYGPPAPAPKGTVVTYPTSLGASLSLRSTNRVYGPAAPGNSTSSSSATIDLGEISHTVSGSTSFSLPRSGSLSGANSPGSFTGGSFTGTTPIATGTLQLYDSTVNLGGIIQDGSAKVALTGSSSTITSGGSFSIGTLTTLSGLSSLVYDTGHVSDSVNLTGAVTISPTAPIFLGERATGNYTILTGSTTSPQVVLPAGSPLANNPRFSFGTVTTAHGSQQLHVTGTPQAAGQIDGLPDLGVSDVDLGLTGLNNYPQPSTADPQVLQMTYDPDQLSQTASAGSAGGIFLSWLNPDGSANWQNAINGNFSSGDSNTFGFSGVYAGSSATTLGAWGVDTSSPRPWEVLGVGSAADAVDAISAPVQTFALAAGDATLDVDSSGPVVALPEPGTLALALFAAAAVPLVLARRRSSRV